MWNKLNQLRRDHGFIVGVALLAVLVIGALWATERILLAMVNPEPTVEDMLRDLLQPGRDRSLLADQLGFWVNVMTEVFGIGITVVIIDRINQRRAAAQQREQDIKRIIREMRSPSADEGGRAILEAKEMGILRDGTLNGVDLRGANLSGAILQEANLSRANLNNANLSGAKLWYANLSGAFLRNADLSGADLRGANLSEAGLSHANLSWADLRGANLSWADLRNANLSRARLWLVIFHKETILPDSTTWIPDTDMARYTNPDHPDYWQIYYVAAGFETYQEWKNAGYPHPWVAAGYGEDDWNEWVLAGKLTLEESRQQGRIPIWEAAGFDTRVKWVVSGYPHPWEDAGYGRDEWNEWVRDGKPFEKGSQQQWVPAWEAAGLDTWREWHDANRPRPWTDAGYKYDEWNEWVRDGKPAHKPTNNPDV